MLNKLPLNCPKGMKEGPNPGDYRLGSAASRAAARSTLKRKFAGRERLNLILDLGTRMDDLKIGEWEENKDGTFTRVSIIPEGMSMEEAERIWEERRQHLG